MAGLCALKNDDIENVKNGQIKQKVENFIEKDLDLYNVSKKIEKNVELSTKPTV